MTARGCSDWLKILTDIILCTTYESNTTQTWLFIRRTDRSLTTHASAIKRAQVCLEGQHKCLMLFLGLENAMRRTGIVNGLTSRELPLPSWVAQGFPLPPLLFILMAEALNRLVLKDINKRHKDTQAGTPHLLICCTRQSSYQPLLLELFE